MQSKCHMYDMLIDGVCLDYFLFTVCACVRVCDYFLLLFAWCRVYRLKVLESPHWSTADKLLALETVTKDRLEVGCRDDLCM